MPNNNVKSKFHMYTRSLLNYSFFITKYKVILIKNIIILLKWFIRITKLEHNF